MITEDEVLEILKEVCEASSKGGVSDILEMSGKSLNDMMGDETFDPDSWYKITKTEIIEL